MGVAIAGLHLLLGLGQLLAQVHLVVAIGRVLRENRPERLEEDLQPLLVVGEARGQGPVEVARRGVEGRVERLPAAVERTLRLLVEAGPDVHGVEAALRCNAEPDFRRRDAHVASYCRGPGRSGQTTMLDSAAPEVNMKARLLALGALLPALLACSAERRPAPETGGPRRAIGASEGALSIVAWAGYVERGATDKAYDWVTGFESASGCKVSVKTAATSDEMVALMNEGGFDLVTASGDASLRLISGGKVQEIDPKLVPSYGKVDPRLQSAPWHTVSGKHYGVPYQWGSNVLMYNTKVFKEAPTSWDIVFQEQKFPDGKSNKGPGAGLRRPHLHRRRRPLPEASQAGARHPGRLRPRTQAIRRRGRTCSASSARSWAATGTTPSSRWTTS